jgi:adenosylhomocysteinase
MEVASLEPKRLEVEAAATGWDDIRRAQDAMPALASISHEFRATLPFEGRRIAAVMHVSKETAALLLSLKAGGAGVLLLASNAATASAEISKALVERGLEVPLGEHATRSGRRERNVSIVERFAPDLLLDNGSVFGDLRARKGSNLRGATVHSQSAREAVVAHHAQHGSLPFPIYTVGSSVLKKDIETYYGTSQSTLQSVLQCTGLQLSGKTVGVVGYGNAGTGIAQAFKALRANVVVCDLDPVRCVKAHFDGMKVSSLRDLLERSDVIIAATPGVHTIGSSHFDHIKDGAFLGSIGHRPDEIEVAELSRRAMRTRSLNEFVEEFDLPTGRVRLIGQGHQLNHVVSAGNSSELMDLSFALHALCLVDLLSESHAAVPLEVPASIVNRVARLKLESLGRMDA